MRVFILIAQLLVFSVATTGLSPDGWALLHFRSNIEDDPNLALSNWNPFDQHPCGWFGVSCEIGKVTSVNLSGLSLKGTLSSELGQLVSLRKLILRGNDLMGGIPFQLGELEKLEVLDLAHNQFSGRVPEELGNLSRLSRLILRGNDLMGGIPFQLGELEKLEVLDLAHNQFSGRVPEELGNLLRLSRLYLENNCLEGIIPAELGELEKLCELLSIPGGPVTPTESTCLSFNFNCLVREGLPHQGPIEDCTRASYSAHRRRLLQSDGSAEVPVTNGTESNNITTPFSISNGSSPAPSPAKEPTASNSLALPPTSSKPPSPSPEAAPSPSAGIDQHKNSSQTTVIAVVVASSIVAGLVIAGIVVFLCYRHKGTAVRPWKSSMSGELQKGFTKGVPAFSRAELEVACEDFSNIIGFSPDIVLFKGTLANGVEIAVTSIRKSAKSWSSNSELIFWRKVESLSRMNHQNLVNLLGYCAEEEPFIRMLVFEYVPNGTVHEHLHNKESEHLDWETRMRIIMGVAYALDYMHHGYESRVTHTKLDTKSVFLSEDFSAKVADFGVWKASVAQKDSKASNERTNVLGHEDLELSEGLVPHLDTNIYDFGVFLLEMVSGRLPYSKEESESLVEWAWSYIVPPRKIVAYIVDPTLESHNSEELEVVARMAYECLQPDSCRTLTMEQISSSLSSSLSSINEPTIPKSSPLLWAELQILSQD